MSTAFQIMIKQHADLWELAIQTSHMRTYAQYVTDLSQCCTSAHNEELSYNVSITEQKKTRRGAGL